MWYPVSTEPLLKPILTYCRLICWEWTFEVGIKPHENMFEISFRLKLLCLFMNPFRVYELIMQILQKFMLLLLEK